MRIDVRRHRIPAAARTGELRDRGHHPLACALKGAGRINKIELRIAIEEDCSWVLTVSPRNKQ